MKKIFSKKAFVESQDEALFPVGIMGINAMSLIRKSYRIIILTIQPSGNQKLVDVNELEVEINKSMF